MSGRDRTRWHLVVAWSVGTVCTAPEPEYRSQGTIRMAERLDSIARAVDANPNQYANEARLSLIRDRAVGADLRSQLLHRAAVAEQLLRTGRNAEASDAFAEIRELIDHASQPVPVEFTAAILDNLAIAYHRLGQDQSCAGDGVPPCGFPPSPPTGSIANAGARQAVAAYAALLRDDPDDMEARWLLNTASMMLGIYPDSVPPEWLIPPDVFETEHELARFADVAPGLGVDVSGLAGGSIAADFDGDGLLDIVASSQGLRDQLRYFRNAGDGTFQDRTLEAGLEGLVGGLHALHADYNNDAVPDILVLRGGWLKDGHYNSLLRGNGDGTFDDVTEAAGLLEAYPTQTAAWSDFDNDGWLDLYIGHESIEPVRNPSRLYRNNRDGTFSNIAEAAGVAVVGFVKGVTAGDYDNDGRPDLYVSRLREPNLLFHNDGLDANGIPTFSERGAAAGVRQPLFSFPTWFFDYDNDGWEDLFVSGFFATSGDYAAEMLGQPHTAVLAKLYHNNRDGTFSDVSAPTRVGRVLLSMGSNFGDVDNDGFLDFYVGTGNPDFQAFMPNRMFRNAGGELFHDVTTAGGFGHYGKGHGVSFADFDNDGDQDIHQVLGGAYSGDVARNTLYVNPGSPNRWITLRAEGALSNRSAIGVRVHLTVATPTGPRHIHRTVGTGGSFGANSLQLEIGLGDATMISSIAITWPTSGTVDTFENVVPNQFLGIREGGDLVALPRPRFDLRRRP